MRAPTGRPVVDVIEFATLARRAERYGLLVLHRRRSGVETFIVQDESTTYGYRTGAGDASDPGSADTLADHTMALGIRVHLNNAGVE